MFEFHFPSPMIHPHCVKLASAARETSVSWHNGGSIKGPLKLLNTTVLWWSNGFQGAFNHVSLMPRDASISDSYEVLLFHSGFHVILEANPLTSYSGYMYFTAISTLLSMIISKIFFLIAYLYLTLLNRHTHTNRIISYAVEIFSK